MLKSESGVSYGPKAQTNVSCGPPERRLQQQRLDGPDQRVGLEPALAFLCPTMRCVNESVTQVQVEYTVAGLP